jgi:hypothetical protein
MKQSLRAFLVDQGVTIDATLLGPIDTYMSRGRDSEGFAGVRSDGPLGENGASAGSPELPLFSCGPAPRLSACARAPTHLRGVWNIREAEGRRRRSPECWCRGGIGALPPDRDRSRNWGRTVYIRTIWGPGKITERIHARVHLTPLLVLHSHVERFHL